MSTALSPANTTTSPSRLYLLKLNGPHSKNFDPIKWRKEQRANDHRRTIEVFIKDAQDRTLHVWITFKKPVPYSEAKRRAKKFFERHLATLAEGFIRVFELQANGRPHWHWLIRLLQGTRACGAKVIRMAIQWHGAAYGFGRHGVEVVKSAFGLAHYLTKGFRGECGQPPGRSFSASANVKKRHSPEASERWNRAIEKFASSCGCKTKAELTERLGVGWAFRYRHVIYAYGRIA
jgi:hypothetical protein